VAVALAAPLSVTVAPVPLAAGLIVPEMLQRGATMLSRNGWDAPLALAVRVAVWSAVTVATVAVKPALTAPAGTVKLAGMATLALLLARVTTNPPGSAAELRPAVHAAVPGAVTLAGVQVRLLRAGTGTIEIVPPTPDAGIELSDMVEATTPVTCTAAEPSGAPGAMVNVAVARMPSPITVLFNPYRMHSVVPLALVHERLLPAAVVLAPATTVTLATTEDE
jgi:hypothetical protein